MRSSFGCNFGGEISGVVSGLGGSREGGGEEGVGVGGLEEEAERGVPVDLAPCHFESQLPRKIVNLLSTITNKTLS